MIIIIINNNDDNNDNDMITPIAAFQRQLQEKMLQIITFKLTYTMLYNNLKTTRYCNNS